MNCTLRGMNWLRHELRHAAHFGGQFKSWSTARNHDAKHQFMTQSVNSLRYARANADGKGVLSAKLNKNVVPYRMFTTSVFDKGQQSFVRVLFDLNGNCVVPIITHYSPLDDADY